MMIDNTQAIANVFCKAVAALLALTFLPTVKANETTGNNECACAGWQWIWLYIVFVLGVLLGRIIMKLELRLQNPATREVEVQSQCTYTRWTANPRFQPLGLG